MNSRGIGMEQNTVRAAELFEMAARQGDANAQANLALMYGFGQGLLQDFVIGHMWANIATLSEAENGQRILQHIAAQMSPESIAAAQSLARQCIQSDYTLCNQTD
jgi:TPR repeat protein